MISVRVLDESEHRQASAVFRGALHNSPPDDDGWERVRTTYPQGRHFGAFEDGQLIGTAGSFAMPLVVPGGAAVPMAAVSRVGVRADRTRRGALTALMREQLRAIAAAGEPVATLRASEYRIYGRFGYGVATRARSLEIIPRRAAMHPDAPAGGTVRLLAQDEVETVVPALYRRIDERRPGTLQRVDAWWQAMLRRPTGGDHPVSFAVHTGPGGDDGFVWYRAESNPTPGDDWDVRLVVEDLHAASPAATAALWRFVLGIDLTNSVRAATRPLDDPLELLLTDARACRTTEVSDETWLRLVDVHAALSARTWGGAEPVVIGVEDPLLPANSGGYGISPDGVKRTDEPPQLRLPVAELARLYLGDVSPSALAGAGRLAVPDPAALPAADALFATGAVPWAGTHF